MDGFGDVLGADGLAAGQVRDGPGDLQHAVIASRRHAERVEGLLHEHGAVLVQLAEPAQLRGLPAVAFSRPRPELEPPQALARHAASLVDAVDWRCCAGKVLNVNYPRCRVAEIKGIRAARMAESRWAENYERREDPAGRPYWWIADFLKRDSGGDDTDIALMEGNWVAVTPLQVDRTDRELLGRLQERFGV